ncbi:MAG: pirin family protein [Chitinophagales bacterium]|jgi:redox-sensitive bicupin YhaK (pirin superfamily)|nr:pirin family protein [Chitinophagales bacterium]HNI43290.1 pirin family protein [Chitinophagales bacterium]HNL06169.1 pirin family protein [Chitinophagales bacterium]
MKSRTIAAIIEPKDPHFVGDGFRVHNFVPSIVPMELVNPFILLDYNSRFYFPPTEQVRGVGVHPHRGFETVSIAYKGKIAHHDSMGNSGIIGEGDVQWMTAGSGILHKEYHEQNYSRQGGDFQMVQLWVNLPAAHKMTEPRYQSLTKEQIPRVTTPDGKGQVAIIAGEYEGHKGAAQTFTPINLYNVELQAGATVEFVLPVRYHTLMIVIEGSVVCPPSKRVATTNQLVYFNNDGHQFNVVAQEKTTLLVINGEPINEPIAAQGPFVMNTKQELLDAYHDFRAGKFGVLTD